MTKISSFRRLRRMGLLLALLTVGFFYTTGITAYAGVDLDVTLVPPPDSVQNGGNCPVELDIVTKSANGYVELVIKIEYDADLLALAAPVNQNGYKVTGSRGQLTLTYFDPTGTNTPTPIGNNEPIVINFTVLENAPDTTTKVKATVDHAYNNKGKNITWTPIYDKTIEIIRINDDLTTASAASEEVSSQFVVGKNIGTITRTTGGGGSGGQTVAVLFGAVIVFAAGVVVGYLVCMKKYGIEGGLFADGLLAGRFGFLNGRGADNTGSAKDGDDGGSPRRRRHSTEDYRDYDDGEDDVYSTYGAVNNDDGYFSKYTRPGKEYTIDGDEDYFTVASSDDDDGYPDVIGGSSPIGSRSLDPSDFSRILGTGTDVRDTPPDDDYPFLFRQGTGISNSTKPFFDESQDSIFGQLGGVERNVDDGYGSPSSGRDRGRAERARRSR